MAAKKSTAAKTTSKTTTEPAVKDEKGDAKLKHTQGGVTTRDDATDIGVPMLQGSPKEPQGPEDALGEGPKRGDYSEALGAGYRATQTVPVPDAKPGEPNVRVVDQTARASDQGEVAGKKGGVETAGS